jgi:5'-phosphate synthase pdxT subunit
LTIKGLAGEPFEGVFIRAPVIESVGPDVEVLSQLESGAVVAARQANMLGTSFHPELTKDVRVHQLFLNF